MKKFYAFAAAALCALAANAQTLYITGAGGFANGEWNAETPDEFAIVDGNYEIEVAGLTQFKISTAAGDWDTFNAGAYGCLYGEEQGVAVALEQGYTENIVTPWDGDYKVVVSGDLSTITLTTNTPKPDPDAIPNVYVKGDMNDWLDNEAWKMTGISKTLFKFELADGQAIQLGEAFKFADEKYNAVNVGSDGEAIMLDTDTEVFNGGNPANITLEEAFTEGVIWLTLDYEGSAYVYFSTDASYVPEWAEESGVQFVEASNAAAQYFTLQGVRVANPENGLYIVVKDGKSYKTVIK